MLEIRPDLTLLIQIGLFLIFMWTLNRTLFKPALRVLEERDHRIAGGRREAADLDARISETMSTYESSIREARAQGEKMRARFVQEASAEEARIAAAGRTRAAEATEKIRAEISRETRDARSELEGRVAEFADLIAERALGRRVA